MGLDIFGDGSSASKQKVSKDPMFWCPVCRRHCKPIVCNKIVDFQVVDSYQGCPFCKSPVETPKQDSKPLSSTETNNKSPSALDSLLGVKQPKKSSHSSILEKTEDNVPFCKNCEFYLIHPYKTHCCKFDRPTDPNGDCQSFQKRQPKKTN